MSASDADRAGIPQPPGFDNPFPGSQTDLYQLTMAAAYFSQDMTFPASFELHIRRLPRDRGYLLAAGLEQVLDYLAQVRFSGAEVDFLRGLPIFAQVQPRFFEWLRDFRFTGSVQAVPEGTPVFAHQPILRVSAPVIEAQLLETWLLSMINFQTLIATKASRIVQAARGRSVVEFGLRRAHGPAAGDLAARAAFVGGCDGTSNVLAGQRYGIPVVGTAAHSWILANPDEDTAFRRFFEIFPKHTILLIDTFDTLAGARKACALGPALKGVRIDSGDFLSLSRAVRKILDAGGLPQTRIVLSGDLNEYRIDELLREQAPIDTFGVGTELVTSRDQPALGGVYKLVETCEGGTPRPVMKFSEDKVTLPGRKQVFRNFQDARAHGDVIALDGETLPGTPLLVPQIAEGRRVSARDTLTAIRTRAQAGVAALPDGVRRLTNPDPYPVTHSEALTAMVTRLTAARRTS